MKIFNLNKYKIISEVKISNHIREHLIFQLSDSRLIPVNVNLKRTVIDTANKEIIFTNKIGRKLHITIPYQKIRNYINKNCQDLNKINYFAIALNKGKFSIIIGVSNK